MKRRPIWGLLSPVALALGLNAAAPASAQNLSDLLRAGGEIYGRLRDGDRWDNRGVLMDRSGRRAYYEDSRGRTFYFTRDRDGDLVRRFVDRDDLRDRLYRDTRGRQYFLVRDRDGDLVRRYVDRDDEPRRRFFTDDRGRFYYIFDRDGTRYRRYVETW